MREQVISLIEQNKIIAILRGVNPSQAVEVAKAIYQGGINLIEVTFNQNNIAKFNDTVLAIRKIKNDCPKMCVGAGTVLTKEQVDLAISAGAEYIISPDTDEEVIKYTVEKGLVSIPGAYTPSEVKKAHNAGADFVKLFPCSDATHLKTLKLPFSQVKFLAFSGVNIDNAQEFINAGAVGVGVGSAIINIKHIENNEYEKITQLAKALVEKVSCK